MHETRNNFIIYGSQYDKSNKNASVMVVVALCLCNNVQITSCLDDDDDDMVWLVCVKDLVGKILVQLSSSFLPFLQVILLTTRKIPFFPVECTLYTYILYKVFTN